MIRSRVTSLWGSKAAEANVTVSPDADAVSTGSDTANRRAEDLKKFQKQHKWDPFLDIDKLEIIEQAVLSGDIEKEAVVEESLLENDSPYLEVRASVWILGLEIRNRVRVN
jgi:hypothetical protein